MKEMLDFMDCIEECIDGALQGVGEFAAWAEEKIPTILGVLGKICILIATPIWIIPYKVIKAREGREDAGKRT